MKATHSLREMDERRLRGRRAEAQAFAPRLRNLLHDLNLAMVIAVARVRVVQMPVYQVIHVVSVRNSIVSAILPMHVRCIVTTAIVAVGAIGRVGGSDLKLVLVHVSLVQRVQVTVVEVVGVILVLDSRMAALFTVLVRMVDVRDVFL